MGGNIEEVLEGEVGSKYVLKMFFGINFTKNKIFNFTLKIKGIGFCEIQLESGGRGDKADGRK